MLRSATNTGILEYWNTGIVKYRVVQYFVLLLAMVCSLQFAVCSLQFAACII